MDKQLKVWKPKQVKEIMIQEADKYFNEQIRNTKPSGDAKNWHKAVKNFCHYNKKSTMLNLDRGPVADIVEWRLAELGDVEWEGIKICQEQTEIALMNIQWIQTHFQSTKAKKCHRCINPIYIDPMIVRNAIYKMGKNKAQSHDGIMDIIFKAEEWDRIRIDGYNPILEEEIIDQHMTQSHRSEVL